MKQLHKIINSEDDSVAPYGKRCLAACPLGGWTYLTNELGCNKETVNWFDKNIIVLAEKKFVAC